MAQAAQTCDLPWQPPETRKNAAERRIARFLRIFAFSAGKYLRTRRRRGKTAKTALYGRISREKSTAAGTARKMHEKLEKSTIAVHFFRILEHTPLLLHDPTGPAAEVLAPQPQRWWLLTVCALLSLNQGWSWNLWGALPLLPAPLSPPQGPSATRCSWLTRIGPMARSR